MTTERPDFRIRKRNQMRLSMTMLPNHRTQPPAWVLRIRRKRLGPLGWMKTPAHRKMLTVMVRKARLIRVNPRKAL